LCALWRGCSVRESYRHNEAVALILNVQPGSIVFLDCGCMGSACPARPEQRVLVIVERPCELHEQGGRPQLRYLDPLDSVDPFMRAET
jgi:hypothetical protein